MLTLNLDAALAPLAGVRSGVLALALALAGLVPAAGCAQDVNVDVPSQDSTANHPSADDMFDAYLDEDRALIAAWRDQRSSASLAEELAHRKDRDQLIRQLILEMMQTPGAGPDGNTFTWIRLINRMQGLDRDNSNWLKAQLETLDWFTISEFGEEADNNAFLIVQHATHDLDFMRDIHARFERLLPLGEIAPDNYALLTDRLAVSDGQPQPYGSQFECRDGLQSLQTPLADPEPVVDARRAEVGLPSLVEYRALLPDCSSIPGQD